MTVSTNYSSAIKLVIYFVLPTLCDSERRTGCALSAKRLVAFWAGGREGGRERGKEGGVGFCGAEVGQTDRQIDMQCIGRQADRQIDMQCRQAGRHAV